VYLFPRLSDKAKARVEKQMSEEERLSMPPITLLVMTVAENIIFDPSHSELAVADAVFAVSVGLSGTDNHSRTILAVRTIQTPARDTMRGVPASGDVVEGDVVPGVWKPKVGGLKRDMLKRVVRAVAGGNGADGENVGVAQEVFDGLEGFLRP